MLEPGLHSVSLGEQIFRLSLCLVGGWASACVEVFNGSSNDACVREAALFSDYPINLGER